MPWGSVGRNAWSPSYRERGPRKKAEALRVRCVEELRPKPDSRRKADRLLCEFAENAAFITVRRAG
nr:MAG TPA: hypothetical protein [Caudoviricetes sp.]